MNGYTVFLGPFAGIMVADYWLVHRGRVDVPAMYDPHGRYRYWYGIVSSSISFKYLSEYGFRTGAQH